MENTAVPYIVYESAQARAERNARRLTIALVIAVLLVFISNAAWLWAWMQYDYTSDTNTTETVTIDSGEGTANYANHGGSIINGENHSQDENDAHPYQIAEKLAGNAESP